MTPSRLPCSEEFAQRCQADGEFRLAARYWNGGLQFACGEATSSLRIANGHASAVESIAGDGVIRLSAAEGVWEDLLSARPPRLRNDAMGLIWAGQMEAESDPILLAQYYPAVARAIEVLRPACAQDPVADELGETPRFDSPVGRYIHLDIGGIDHRIYYEEAGAGVPVLLQHTAGGHGIQYRHLFESKAITDHFRLIAYDLPYHGKSIPPVGKEWWREQYRLTADFLRSVPLTLAKALNLDRPVFMGCSVGGALALDLAYHHPEAFRAVISLEGVLKVQGEIDQYALLWHPGVSSEFKARAMNGAMSPTSPQCYRYETMQVYAAGWPPCFVGDLHYYLTEFDLREHAGKIDTRKLGVHILVGEYDSSGTEELAREAHEAIPGSTLTTMRDVGHFPMSENPVKFLGYLMPVLDSIRRAG